MSDYGFDYEDDGQFYDDDDGDAQLEAEQQQLDADALVGEIVGEAASAAGATASETRRLAALLADDDDWLAEQGEIDDRELVTRAARRAAEAVAPTADAVKAAENYMLRRRLRY